MFVGHYAAAFVAKRIEPRLPLWSLLLAVQLVDVAWGVLILLGIERATIDLSLPGNPLVLSFMPISTVCRLRCCGLHLQACWR